MSGLQEALTQLRQRADGHDARFSVLDASYVLAELTRLRAFGEPGSESDECGGPSDEYRSGPSEQDRDRDGHTAFVLRYLAGELRDGPPAWFPDVADSSWLTEVTGWLGYHADQQAIAYRHSTQPQSPDLPATLATVDDVRRVCEAAGLRPSSDADGGEVSGMWNSPAPVLVMHVDTGIHVHGESFAETLPFGSTGSELTAAIQAARSTS